MINKTIYQDKPILIALFAYIFVLLFFCSKMSPLYPINEWSDINLYFNMGKALFNGSTPYTEAFDHKGPLIFFIYGLGYLISHTSFSGMFILELIGWVILGYSAYYTARLFLEKEYSFLVALAFPLIVLTHTQEGGSAEEFILFAQAISTYFFIRYFKEKDSVHNPKYMLIHGVMSSIAFFIKLNVVLYWLFPLLAVFISIAIAKRYKSLLYNVVYYLIGFAIIAMPVCFYLWINDAMSEAYNTYIVLNSRYAHMTSEHLLMRFYLRLRFDFPDFIIILLGASVFPIFYLKNIWGKVAFILSFVCLFVMANVSFNYSPYYAIPYYIFGLASFIVIADYLSKYIKISLTYPLIVFFALIGVFIGVKEKDYFGIDANILMRKEASSEYIDQISEYVEKEPAPTLLNLGHDEGNGVFTKTGIIPNVKYFISPNLLYSTYPEMRDEQTKYIENKEVQFIILSETSLNYEYFSQLKSFNDNYCQLARFDHILLYKMRD